MNINFVITLDVENLKKKALWEREEIVARELATIEQAVYQFVRDLSHRGY